MVERNSDRREDIDRLFKIVEKLSALDAKFDSFIIEFLKDREFNQSEIKEILGRLALLEKEGTTVMREGLAAQHSAMLKVEEAIAKQESCYVELRDKYIRLKWIIGSVTVIIVPLISGLAAYLIHYAIGG